MKKFLLIAVAVSSLLFASKVYAGGVTDNNNGNKGYILVSTGEDNGANSIGHWTDPSFLKGDTGERGETGATGQDGQGGINGLDGQAGRDGQAGYTPIKGIDYNDGKDGAVGETGNQGEAGQDGKTPVKGADYKDGLNGTDGKTPIKNIDYFDGIKGLNGIDGKDVDPKTVNELNNKIDNNSNRINKLEESQYIVGGVLRIKSTKKWDVDLFADYSTNRQMIDRSGIRFTYKVGESYTDKKINELENRIRKIEKEK